jgi:predicted permease
VAFLPDDVRVAVRRLRRSPVFAALAVTSLALAIGANTAVFSAVDAVLFARLPFPSPDRLVGIWEEHPARGWSRFGVSAPAVTDWQRQARALAHVAAFTRHSANLAGPERPQRVDVVEATAEVFDVFGLRPLAGRAFMRDEQLPGRDAVVLLAHEYWRQAFASDPGVVGRTLRLDGVPHAVVGVLPPAAQAAFADAQVWRPLVLGDDTRRGARWLQVVARLRPGVALEAARGELAALARRQEEAYPATNRGWTAAVVPLRDARADSARPLLVALSAAVALVLLIACANLAGLMLARIAERDAELAVRAALGAGSARLARLLAAEGLVVAALGGAAGLALSAALRRLLARVLADAVPGAAGGVLDARVAVFAAAVTAAAAGAFALAPLSRVRRGSLEQALRAGGRGTSRSRFRARRVLVAVQLSIAVTLISAAGLLVRTVRALVSVDPGFDRSGVLTFRVAPPQSRPQAGQSEDEFVRSYLAERDRMSAFYAAVLERLRALPGVRAAGAVNRMPLTGRWWAIGYAVEGQPPPAAGERPSAAGRVVTPGYFEALGVPVRAGRVPDARDTANAPAVVVVSESLARRAWPGEAALGRRLVVDERQTATVIGVVADVRFEGLDRDAPEVLYVPFAQATFGLFPDWGLDVLVRAPGAPAALAAAVRAQVAAVDSSLPVFALRTLDEVQARSMAARRAAMALLGLFAVLAALLSAVGLYAVIAESARQRTRELGVRMALGARPGDVARLVMGEGAAVAAAGGALGLAGAGAAGRLMRTLLFEVRPGDPATVLAAAAALALLAVGASLAPALRAGRLDPLAALRDE